MCPDYYHRSIRENLLQRFWHRTRFRVIRDLIPKTNGTILDLGCADGVFTSEILDSTDASNIIGIDVLEHSIELAKHWNHKPQLTFLVGDAHNLDFAPDTFDGAISLEMMEHVVDPSCVLAEIRRVLKPGGFGLFLVPTDSPLFRVIWFVWTKLKGKIWEDAHIQSFKNGSLGNLVEQSGFTIVKEKYFLCGMLYAVVFE